MIFLIEYDRPSGTLVSMQSFTLARRDQAEERRLSAEMDALHRGISREIVLIDARNEAELRKTHRRYFESPGQLANPATVDAS
jgi:hypothetical protein